MDEEVSQGAEKMYQQKIRKTAVYDTSIYNSLIKINFGVLQNILLYGGGDFSWYWRSGNCWPGLEETREGLHGGRIEGQEGVD